MSNALYSADGRRNYSAMFRTAFEFLRIHTPPRLDASYLEEVTADVERLLASSNDAFLRDLLSVVNYELGRELDALAQDAFRSGTMPPTLAKYFAAGDGRETP